MSQRKKLIEAIRNNTRDVRFDDAIKVAKWMGFTAEGHGGGGSHRVFARPGEPTQLNFQNKGGRIKPYHARQLVEMIDKYESVILERDDP